MPVRCPTCSKVNPASAAYCYYDGRSLGQVVTKAPLGPGTMLLPRPFPYSDGQDATNFNQLVLASDRRWNESRANLYNGKWEEYFHSIARPDLAALARQAAREADPDMGLCRLLEGLPADPEALRPPKLGVPSPFEDLGALEPGMDYQFQCVVENQGLLLLRGSATTDGDWLVFGDGHGSTSSKHFQTRDTHTLTVRVVGQKLRAGARPLEGQIIVDTNGGCQVIPVRATVPIRPFPRFSGTGTVLAGARTPRELAVKSKAHPKEAAVLFEQGAVKSWYESNGWTYPVQGSQAQGKGAVQQFFEALGLTQPPRLEISSQRIDCGGKPGQHLLKKVVVRTAEAKFVNVEARSSQRWLKVLPAKSDGNSVTIPLRIDVPESPGETLQATVTFRGNGKQVFVVPVMLTVTGITPEQEEKKERRGRRLEWALAGVGLLVFLAIGGPIAYHLYSSVKSQAAVDPLTQQGDVDPVKPGAVPAVVRAAWWDKLPDKSLAASYAQLKDKAGVNGLIVDGVAVEGDRSREDAYKQLAAKLPELAHNKDAREPLRQFVTGCCVYDPQQYVIRPLLRGLAARFPRPGRPFPPDDKGTEVELADFWHRVACDVLTHNAVTPNRRDALTGELDKVGYVLDTDGSPNEVKEKVEKAFAEQFYHSMALTVEQSPEQALAIRKALIDKYPTRLTAASRARDDVKLLEAVFAAGETKDNDLWMKLEPIFRDCAESNDGNAGLRVVDLYEKARDVAEIRIELALGANAKWGKILANKALSKAAKAKALRNRIAAQSEEAKKARAERVKQFQDQLAKTRALAGQPGTKPFEVPLRLTHASTLASLLVEEDAEPALFDDLIGQVPGAQPAKPSVKEEPPASKADKDGEEPLIDPNTNNNQPVEKKDTLDESCKSMDTRRNTYRRVYPIKLKAGEIYEFSVESKDFAPSLRLEYSNVPLQQDNGKEDAPFKHPTAYSGRYTLVVSTTDPSTDDGKRATGSYTLKVTRQQQAFRFFGGGLGSGMGSGMGGGAERPGGLELKATPLNDKDVEDLKDISGEVRARAFKNLVGSVRPNLGRQYAERFANYFLRIEWLEDETRDVKPLLSKVARCGPLLQALDDIIANNHEKVKLGQAEVVFEGLFEEPPHFTERDWPAKARKLLLRRMIEVLEKHKSAAGGDDKATEQAASFLCNLYKDQGLAFGMESAALEGPTQLTEVLESLIKHVAARADKKYAKQIDRQVRATAFVAGDNDFEHAVLLQRVWLDVLVHDLEGDAPEEAKKKMEQLRKDLEKKDRQAAGTLLDQLRLGEEAALGVWEIVLGPKPK